MHADLNLYCSALVIKVMLCEASIGSFKGGGGQRPPC